MFAPALAVADAVLYEGYLLYPYTASAPKNRVRWQFGVVVPQAYAGAGTGEPAEQQTEVLIEADAGAAPRVTVLLRFLQVEARRVEAFGGGGFEPVASLVVGGTTYLTFDEGAERQVTVTVEAVPGAEQVDADRHRGRQRGGAAARGPAARAGGSCASAGRCAGTLAIRCDAVAGAPALRKLRVRVENESAVVAGERSGALRTAFVSTHALLAVERGSFVSVLDPPPSAAAATAALANRHVFPVLVGDAGRRRAARRRWCSSSPIILYDFPAVAPQSEADAFDATEVDELLMLSVLSLPDAERAEACATDPRARAIVERAERFGTGELARLHAGTLYHAGTLHDAAPARHAGPAGTSVFPGGRSLRGRRTRSRAATRSRRSTCRGSTACSWTASRCRRARAVRLHPKRRADAWDMFLAGKVATVQAVHQDLEDVMYVAVTVDDDPASDLHEWYGRSFFFYPDEIEPLGSAG